MTTRDELTQICREVVDSEGSGESIITLFEAIMDYPLDAIPVRPSVGQALLYKKDDLAYPVTLTEVPQWQ